MLLNLYHMKYQSVHFLVSNITIIKITTMTERKPDPLELRWASWKSLLIEKELKAMSSCHLSLWQCSLLTLHFACILTPTATLRVPSKNPKAGAEQLGQTVNPSFLSCSASGGSASTQFCWFGSCCLGVSAQERLSRPWINKQQYQCYF